MAEHESKSEFSYTLGTCVRTLTMSVASKTFEGAVAHPLRLEPNSFTARETPWCYLVGSSFVVCRGVIVGRCPKDHDPSQGRNIRIARLPVQLRPRRPLQFAALAREPTAGHGGLTYNSHLVTIVVTPDGMISGMSVQEKEAAIDLSAIRFAIDGGISLVDQVSLHTVDVAGSRLVTLQGTLAAGSYFMTHKAKAIALLPESCRPPQDYPFVTSGSCHGGFHLLTLRPLKSNGVGGDLWWKDSVWNHDQIHLTGVMYEVAEGAMSASTLDSNWKPESLKVFVQDFQTFLIRKFGSIDAAWDIAFDTDRSGSVNFTEFGMACKATGYVGNATRLWAAFDDDRSGEISREELKIGMSEEQISEIASRSESKAEAAARRKMSSSEPWSSQATALGQ